MTAAQQPIGVFDSGVGGLSVLQALRAELPHERFVYLADSGNAPYGERGDAFVQARTHAIADYLCLQHHIKALVVACNTATAAAIHEARERYPQLPLVGVEPALKPAVAASKTGHIGVIGTRGTLTSAKFAKLLASLDGQAHFVVQPCDGLAHAIERSTAQAVPAASDATETRALCARYTGAMGRFGTQAGEMDTLVLGCTHYPFATDILQALSGPDVRLVETGAPVARRTRAVLGLPETHPSDGATPQITLLSTGDPAPLAQAAARWLGTTVGATHISV